MEYEHYHSQAQEMAGHVEAGRYEEAIGLVRSLLESDISDIDKSMMCVNMAIICDKMGYHEESFAWYDEGIRYEEPHLRYHAAESRAAYLAARQRTAESLAAYRNLLDMPALTESDRYRIRHNIAALESGGQHAEAPDGHG